MTIYAGTWEPQEQGGYQLGADGAEISGVPAITSQYPQVLIPAVTHQTTSVEQKTPESAAPDTTTVTYVLNKNTKKVS